MPTVLAYLLAITTLIVSVGIRPDQRGVISGMLNLSRNLGLITGASVMGAVFALGSATSDITTARPEAVAAGMRITFAVAAGLIVVALAVATGAYRRTLRLRELASEVVITPNSQPDLSASPHHASAK